MALSDVLTTALGRARRLCAAGDLAGAHAALTEVLVDPNPDELVHAAALRLYAAVLTARNEPGAALEPATAAVAACRAGYGPTHPEAVAAATTLAAVRQALGDHAGAESGYRRLLTVLSIVDKPGSRRLLGAQADLAGVLSAAGRPGAAWAMLNAAAAEHAQRYGDGDPTTIKMVARLGRLARDGGDIATARRYVSAAVVACRRYLPPEHPLAVQVAALASGLRATTVDRPAQYRYPRHSQRRRSRLPAVVLTTAGLALLLAGSLALADRLAPRGAATTPPVVEEPSAPAADPPSGLRLDDRGGSVVLTWLLPAGAEGPMVVSGASRGKPPRAFETLLPGTTTYTVAGLNPQLDYCFDVALVYTADLIARSSPACTRR